jgi:hypothetical protein
MAARLASTQFSLRCAAIVGKIHLSVTKSVGQHAE